MKKSIIQIIQREIEECADREITKVIKNILDPNTEPKKKRKIGTEESPADLIQVFQLTESWTYGQVNEFVIDFYSGTIPTTVALPDSVEWADELTVEANKHYQISIVSNIALWCAVDIEVEEEEE